MTIYSRLYSLLLEYTLPTSALGFFSFLAFFAALGGMPPRPMLVRCRLAVRWTTYRCLHSSSHNGLSPSEQQGSRQHPEVGVPTVEGGVSSTFCASRRGAIPSLTSHVHMQPASGSRSHGANLRPEPAVGEPSSMARSVLVLLCSISTLDLRRGYAFPPNQVNDSNKGSAGSRSGKLHSEERDGLRVTGRSQAQ